MADHCEEQEMEAEALTAIFDDCLEIISASQPFKWAVTLYPEQHTEGDDSNHVGIKLTASIPMDYPESLPTLDIEILKGLVDEHQTKLLEMANEEAEANLGLPSIYAVCEKLREWLAENNEKGLDDTSMFAQMRRRELESKKATEKSSQQFETQKHVEEMTEAEAEDLAVRKKRAEGTPVTKESFAAWTARFQAELAQKAEEEAALEETTVSKKLKKEKVVDKTGRISGALQFSGKTGGFSLEDIEAAAENAEVDEDEEDDEDLAEGVDQELFDVDDDDLDDLDFDDSDEDEDPDI